MNSFDHLLMKLAQGSFAEEAGGLPAGSSRVPEGAGWSPGQGYVEDTESSEEWRARRRLERDRLIRKNQDILRRQRQAAIVDPRLGERSGEAGRTIEDARALAAVRKKEKGWKQRAGEEWSRQLWSPNELDLSRAPSTDMGPRLANMAEGIKDISKAHALRRLGRITPEEAQQRLSEEAQHGKTLKKPIDFTPLLYATPAGLARGAAAKGTGRAAAGGAAARGAAPALLPAPATAAAQTAATKSPSVIAEGAKHGLGWGALGTGGAYASEGYQAAVEDRPYNWESAHNLAKTMGPAFAMGGASGRVLLDPALRASKVLIPPAAQGATRAQKVLPAAREIAEDTALLGAQGTASAKAMEAAFQGGGATEQLSQAAQNVYPGAVGELGLGGLQGWVGGAAGYGLGKGIQKYKDWRAARKAATEPAPAKILPKEEFKVGPEFQKALDEFKASRGVGQAPPPAGTGPTAEAGSRVGAVVRNLYSKGKAKAQKGLKNIKKLEEPSTPSQLKRLAGTTAIGGGGLAVAQLANESGAAAKERLAAELRKTLQGVGGNIEQASGGRPPTAADMYRSRLPSSMREYAKRTQQRAAKRLQKQQKQQQAEEWSNSP